MDREKWDRKFFIRKEQIEDLTRKIQEKYRLVYPTLKDGVITYVEWKGEELAFPEGVKEHQAPGFYRIHLEAGGTFNGWTHGMNSLKEFLHPKNLTFLRISKDLEQEVPELKGGFAFFGIRNCDLSAVKVLDRVLKDDLFYSKLRENNLFVVVNCVEPSGTCFCTSVGGSPFAVEGFDLAITELKEGFLISVGSPKGQEVLDGLDLLGATREQLEEEEALKEKAVEFMKKAFSLENLPEKLLKKVDSTCWEAIERRCLACGSCTMVCPTCFCYEVKDEFLSEEKFERIREWDSCFRLGFSETHHIPIRKSIASRYRHWLLHKFSYWSYQFSTLGCVGCGRCITWCPVGIDVREEVRRVLNA